MPCRDAHTLSGFSVRDRLPQPLAALLARNEAAFLAGLPGPDIYFFDRFPPPLLHPHEKRTGNALHNAPADTVFAQLLSLAAGDEALLAYTLGFLCHYALDSAIHPFVDARYRGLDHTRFEMRLELAFCAQRGSGLCGIPPHRLYAPPVREPGLLDRLDALQYRLAQAVCGRGAHGAFRRSFYKFRRTNRLLYDPAGRKRRLLQHVERLLGRPARCPASCSPRRRRATATCSTRRTRPRARRGRARRSAPNRFSTCLTPQWTAPRRCCRSVTRPGWAAVWRRCCRR